MRRRNHHHAGNKRRSYDGHAEEEEIVDDLAHAATFAMMTMIPTSTLASTTLGTATMPLETVPGTDTNKGPSSGGVDDTAPASIVQQGGETDDIELEESSSSSAEENDGDDKSGGDEVGSKSGGENDDDDSGDDDDDDDQSDVDFAAELARMDPDEVLEEDEDEDDDYHQPSSSNKIPRAPKTEHEMDAYRTPIQELEKHMQFQLSVTPDDSGNTATAQQQRRQLTASNLQLAGCIKHFMALDRTVVVESAASNPHGDVTSFRNEKAPLDEGTLLVFRPPPQEQNDGSIPVEDGDSGEQLIPLGRIFEVFGPVSHPLYTIRLPSSMLTTKKKQQPSKSPRKATSTVEDQGTTTTEVSSTSDQVESSPVIVRTTDENNKGGDTEMTERQPTGDVEQPTENVPNEDTAMVQQGDSAHNTTTISIAVEPAAITTAEPSTTAPSVEKDPWGPNGSYTKLLQQNQAIPVYFVRDEAKLIDTGLIMKMSRKGCDASNLYDEEVLTANEMYYSDDEEERQAKNQRRKSKGSNNKDPHATSEQDTTMTNVRSAPLPTGFHHGLSSRQRPIPPPPPPPPPSPASGALPQGFHQAPYANQRPPDDVVPTYRPQHYGMPPAPNRPFPYPQFAPNAPNGAPPPPPPPGSSAPPPAYQY